MKKIYFSAIAIIFAIAILFTTAISCNAKHESETEIEGEEENDMYDNPEAAANFQLKRTRDLTTGQIPEGAYMDALNETLLKKSIVTNSTGSTNAFTWVERGPDTDVSGPSNGNTRANGGITSGRIDAIMVDSADATHKTLFAGGRGGGLWKTTDITATPATWTLVNDFLLNQSIAAICQDPTDFNIMYMATGESYGEGGAIRGNGVFKSIDHGVTWAQLSSSTSYFYCTRILCDAAGNIYLGTNGNGLLRSTKASGGGVWTNISPTSATRIADLDLSSTGRLHVTTGIFSASSYRFTDNPASVTAATWTAPTTPYTAFNARCEIAVLGNTLYALPGNTSYQVPTIFKSTDGGDNWAATGGQPATGWASGQAWYGLTAMVNPSNPDECIVGGLDQHKTTNGGVSWTKISAWVGTVGQYVHADSHQSLWFDGGNKIVFACDGGIHYSADGGATIRDRNRGLRIKEFYSVAMHPTNVNYFLAGAQDNGTHQLNNPGLAGSVEVTGGDGAFVDIDQDEPQFQYGAYVYNNYRRSTNGGANWSSVNFSNTNGQFINPFDYDDVANIMYCGYGAGNFLRWENPQTGNTTTVVPVTSFNSGAATSMQASPYTANTVFFGTTNGRVVKLIDANNTTLLTEVNITPTGMSGYVNSINVGASDQNLVATVTNYGVNNVWVSNNGGTTWSAVDGNLPNLPVYWALFNPDDNTKLIIATETGVWQTDLLNGAATNWLPDPTFPTVRVTMLKYRALDRAIGASSYGRGVWSTTLPPLSCVPVAITANPTNTTVCAGTNASFSIITTGSPTITYQWYVSVGSGPFNSISGANAATYSFTTTAFQTGNQYRCIATGSCGVPLTQASTAATLTVTAAPVISAPLNTTVCAGANTSFTATVAGGTTFKWQVSTNGGTTFTDVPNAAPYSNVTTTTLNITGASLTLNNYQYRLVAATGTCSSNSTAATLTVNTAATIIDQPANATVCNGTAANFVVVATGTAVTYQWQLSTTGVAGTYSNVITGAGGSTANYTTGVTIPSNNGTYYRVVVTSASCAPAVASTPVLLTVNTFAAIGTQPTAKSACIPQTATFTVGATGTGLSYQWQVAPSGSTTFADIAGATSANYTTPSTLLSMNGNQYRVNILSTCSPLTPTVSIAALLTVNNPVTITTQPTQQGGCASDNFTFAVVASSPGNILTYQWQISSTGSAGTFVNIGSATSASYNINNAPLFLSGSYYRVYISVPCGTGISSDTSASAKLLLINKPTIVVSKPATSNINPFLNSSLLATVNPIANYVYNWTVNGTAIPNTNTSNVIPLNVDANGMYRVTLKDVLTGCTVFDELSVLAATSDNLLTDRVFTFPNPVSSIMFVRFNTSNNINRGTMLNIYDEKGARVFSKAYSIVGTNGRMQVDMSGLQIGTYIVYIMDANGNKLGSTKVVKVQ